jgi:hypothetical protein
MSNVIEKRIPVSSCHLDSGWIYGNEKWIRHGLSNELKKVK